MTKANETELETVKDANGASLSSEFSTVMGEVMSNDDKTTPNLASGADVAADSTTPVSVSDNAESNTNESTASYAEDESLNKEEEIPNAEVVAASAEEKFHAQQVLMGKKPISEHADHKIESSGENPLVAPVRPTTTVEHLPRKVGDILKFYRQKQGISIERIASELQARASTVVAMEQNALSQETARDYVSVLVAKYASILDLDGKFLVELYNQEVNEIVKITRQKSKHAPADRIMNRSWLILGLVVVVAAGGYFVFKDSNSDNTASTNISIDAGNGSDTGNTAIAQNPNSSTSLVSTINQGASAIAEDNAKNQVTVADEHNQDASKVMVVDENTARATAQSNALQQKATKHAIEQAQQVNTSPDALPLQKESGITFAKSDAPDRQKNTLIDATSTPPAPASSGNRTQVAQSANNAATQNASAATATGAGTAAATVSGTDVAANSSSSANVSINNPDTLKSNEAANKEEVKAEAPALKSKLSDISSKVSVVNREGLASLNSAEITVHGEVALKVIDGSKRVLAHGVYKKGDHVRVTGIPPLHVQVSDTEAVAISYMGGTVKIPKDKQVQFALPMR